MPKKTGDEKKAKVKPAIGHVRKAERAASRSKQTAAARSSKGKPVKQGSARKGRPAGRGKSRAATGRRG
jgi:hypothetical protein